MSLDKDKPCSQQSDNEKTCYITTPELIEELQKRYDSIVVITVKGDEYEGAYIGNWATCIGLIMYATKELMAS